MSGSGARPAARQFGRESKAGRAGRDVVHQFPAFGRRGPLRPLPRVIKHLPAFPCGEAPGAPLCPQRRARHGRRRNKHCRRPVPALPPILPKAVRLNQALPEKARYLRKKTAGPGCIAEAALG